MLIPYNPCNDCKKKNMCDKCSVTFAEENYRRALNKVIELSNELGRKITILEV